MSNQGFLKNRKAAKFVLSLLSLAAVSSSIPVVANPELASNLFKAPQNRLIAQAGRKVLYVNPAKGLDSAEAGRSETAPLRTIAFAIAQAESGTVIQLAPGTYSAATGEAFPLLLKPGVAIVGNEANKGQDVIINGGGRIISPSFAGQNVAILAAKDSEIRGVSVTNTLSRGTGVWIESTNPTIANSTFSGSIREGIFVTGSASPTIIDSQFIRNGGNGISIARAATALIRGNLFQATGFGLAIGGTATPVLEENRIVQNKDGIFVSDSARPTLRRNVISDNERDGLVATSTAQPDLGTTASPGNNIIRRNGQFDVSNATAASAAVTIDAVGNNIDPKKLSGAINFTSNGDTSQPPAPGGIPTTPPTVTPPTTPPTTTPPTTPPSTPPPTTGGLKDIKGHWAEGFIQALSASNVINGFPDGTFRPDAPVTRAQFAAIMNKAYNPAARKPAIEFSDVASNYWAYGAIQTVVKGGFMAGYPNGNAAPLFKPEQRIPRVQLVVAIANGLQYGDGDQAMISRLFTDASTIPGWAMRPVSGAIGRKVIVNHPTLGQFAPNREATRAEVAAMIYQSLVDAGSQPPLQSRFIVMP